MDERRKPNYTNVKYIWSMTTVAVAVAMCNVAHMLMVDTVNLSEHITKPRSDTKPKSFPRGFLSQQTTDR